MNTNTISEIKPHTTGLLKKAAGWIFVAIAAFHQITLTAIAAGGDEKLQAAGRETAKGCGTFVKATTTGKLGPVYVFEEYHNARIGQIQIATMLARLYHTKGLRTVGLEGAVQGPAPLPTDKFLAAADPVARRDSLKRLLRDGEISGAEYAGATLPNIKLVGIENAEEYAVEMKGSGNGAVSAIFEIAQRTVPEKTLMQFILKTQDESIAEKDRGEAALNVLKAADPWIKARFDAIEREDVLLADLVANNKAILDKAASVGVTLSKETRDDLDSAIKFYETAEKRSDTMADNVAALSKVVPGKPVAMVIGAAHTDRIISRFEKNGVSAVVLRAIDFKGDNDKIGTSGFLNKSNGQWATDAPETLGAILNDATKKSSGERKPPPIIGDAKRDGYASAQAAAIIAARAVRGGDKFPDSIVERLKALPGIKVDSTSFKKEGNDVLFAFETEDTAGKMQKIWVRAGTKRPAAAINDPADAALLELEKAEAGGGGSDKPPVDKPKTSGEETPGNKSGKPEIKPAVVITREVQMKFFKSAPEAEKAAMISDV